MNRVREIRLTLGKRNRDGTILARLRVITEADGEKRIAEAEYPIPEDHFRAEFDMAVAVLKEQMIEELDR